jgi:predicted NBD/HSP70 family sugar kinase
MAEYVWGIDIGGTKIRVGKVDATNGKVIELKILSMETVHDNETLTKLVSQELEEKCKIGIASAGVIDEENLIIKYSPNFNIKNGITLARDLKEMGHEVMITNDMRAAVQAAAKYGEGVGYENVAVATYSTGFNAAVARNGINVTSAEIGHMIYDPNSSLFCGCGARGHLEIFVSGSGAAAMAKQYFLITKEFNHPIIYKALGEYNENAKKEGKPTYEIEDLKKKEIFTEIVASITAKHIYSAYREEPEKEPQRYIRELQVKAIADSFAKIVSVWNPIDIIVCMGSQTKDKEILFDPAIKRYYKEIDRGQMPTLKKPKIVITKLHEIGVLGAAAYFMSKNKRNELI